MLSETLPQKNTIKKPACYLTAHVAGLSMDGTNPLSDCFHLSSIQGTRGLVMAVCCAHAVSGCHAHAGPTTVAGTAAWGCSGAPCKLYIPVHCQSIMVHRLHARLRQMAGMQVASRLCLQLLCTQNLQVSRRCKCIAASVRTTLAQQS